jgi:hypothetical protein
VTESRHLTLREQGILHRALSRSLRILVPEAEGFARQRREMAARHAKERAALAAWEIECWHYLREGNSDA